MDAEVIRYLNGRPDASDAATISDYSAYFDGREVLVRVWDRGPNAGRSRFTVEARWETPEPDELPEHTLSHGNSAGTLEEALDNVHWWLFDPR